MLYKSSKILILIMIVLIVFFTAGCWDSVDIEDRDIVTVVVLDKTNEGYTFYVEIPSISSTIKSRQSEQGGGIRQNTNIVKGCGGSIIGARNELEKQMNKAIFLGGVQSLIITKNMAEYGIEEYLYRVRQINDYRKTMDVIVTPDKPEDLLNISPESTTGIGFAIEDTLQNLYDQGLTFHISLQDVLEKLSSKNNCYLLSTIAAKNGQITLNGYTVFDRDKSTGFIPYDQSRGIIYFASNSSNKPRFNYIEPLEDNQVTLEVTLENKKVNAHFDQSKIAFDVDMTYKRIIIYPSSNEPITKQAKQDIKNNLQKRICDELYTTINKSQSSFGCDYLSFSEYFRMKYPNVFNQVNWKEEFKKAKFSMNVTVDIDTDRSLDFNPEEAE